MKKLLLRVCVALVILVVLAIAATVFFLDGLAKRGIVTVGSMLMKVEVKLDSVSLSLLSGGGKIKGLWVANPSGYKSPSAIQVGLASLLLEPRSLFADKVIIRSINVQAPEITFETDLKNNNLSQLLANLQSASGPGAAGEQPGSKAARKLQVDDFVISGGKVHVSLNALGGQSATVALPEIHLKALGQGPDGITAAELAKMALQAIEQQALQASGSVLTDLTKDAAGLTKQFGNSVTGSVDQVTKGLGGFLKKK